MGREAGEEVAGPEAGGTRLEVAVTVRAGGVDVEALGLGPGAGWQALRMRMIRVIRKEPQLTCGFCFRLKRRASTFHRSGIVHPPGRRSASERVDRQRHASRGRATTEFSTHGRKGTRTK
jgi:hypothetical protein